MPPARKRNGVGYPPFLKTHVALVQVQLSALLMVFGYQQMIASVSPIVSVTMLFVFTTSAAVVTIWSVFKYRASKRHAEKLPLYFMVITVSALVIQFVGVLFLAASVHFPILDRAMRLANIYVNEHKGNIRADALAMTNDVNREVPALPRDMLRRFVNAQVQLRSLSFGALVERDGRLVAMNDDYYPAPTRKEIIENIGVLEEANRRYDEEGKGNGIVVFVKAEIPIVSALIGLSTTEANYLVVGRVINKEAVEGWEKTHIDVRGTRRGVWVVYGAMVVLLLLVTAICVLVAKKAQ